MSPLATLTILIILLALTAMFFSVNAIALRTFSLARLQDAFKKPKKKDLIDELVEKSERLILTCVLYRLIANMAVALCLVAFFAALGNGTLHGIDYLLTFVIALCIFSVFSLAIPHAWAKYAGEKILARTYPVLTFFMWISWPLMPVLSLYDSVVKRLVGVPPTTPEEQQEERQEEFLTELEQHKMEGAVDEEEQEMIENVLELSETTADEIMTPRTDVIAVDKNADLKTILDTIVKAGHSRVPVYEDNIDNIVGLIYAKDLLSEIGKDTAQFKLEEKIREAYFVPETKPLRVLLHEFQNQKLHIAIVLDEYGGTAGIVTIEDILEELVGEITDEYEEAEPKPIKKLEENLYEIDARTYIDDINDELEFDLPEDEDYDTVGGFVFSHLGYIPKTGESFEYNGLRFSIRSAEARRVKLIRIQKIPESQDAQ